MHIQKFNRCSNPPRMRTRPILRMEIAELLSYVIVG